VTADAGDALDGLVYAVGTITLRPLPRLTAADFLDDFRVNALGAALAVQAALPALTKGTGGASVVLFSSAAARQGFTAHASIGMAKGAVAGLTLSLAAELAPKVRVNAIAPSLTRTPLGDSVVSSDQVAAALAKLHPLQRLGTAVDSAALAAFLLSADASWMTGQVIGVDGGRATLHTKS
jgi:NAD(P)-dependent dehydrogenase (short-subunit alcohol dehydrogenase family)